MKQTDNNLMKTSTRINIFLAFKIFLACIGFSFIAGCSIPPFRTVEVIPTATSTELAPSTPVHATMTPALSPSPTSSPSPTPSPTSLPLTSICSPLAGIELGDLHSITAQPFIPPTAYTDDGHPAVDLAFFIFKDFPTMLGHPVQSILPGTVVQVVADLFPFGNMIIIETPLESIPDVVQPPVVLPTQIPQEYITRFSPCDTNPLYAGIKPIQISGTSRSLYTLYSHLQNEPAPKIGDRVTCGQTIGAVGITGNSIAEHLHLEVRLGPSGAQFGPIAMYTAEATVEERYNYCIWSMSGRFQAIDPTLFWANQN